MYRCGRKFVVVWSHDSLKLVFRQRCECAVRTAVPTLAVIIVATFLSGIGCDRISMSKCKRVGRPPLGWKAIIRRHRASDHDQGSSLQRDKLMSEGCGWCECGIGAQSCAHSDDCRERVIAAEGGEHKGIRVVTVAHAPTFSAVVQKSSAGSGTCAQALHFRGTWCKFQLHGCHSAEERSAAETLVCLRNGE